MSSVLGSPSFKALFDPASDPFEAIEFELELDLQAVRSQPFATAVRAAATATGGEMLFDMPVDDLVPNASRIAAVRFPSRGGSRFSFAILNPAGDRIRVSGRREIGERFYGLAKGYAGVLDRLRADGKTGNA